MRLLAASLVVALLALGVVLASVAGADPAPQRHQKGSGAGGASTPSESADGPAISNRVAVTAPKKKKKGKRRSHAAPAPAPAPAAPPPTGQLLFANNFDGSFRGWLDVQALPGRATISTAHPFAGTGAGRFEVQPGDSEPQTGDQRAEVAGPNFSAGQDIYVRDEIRIPAGNTFQGPWELINQLHETDWGGSPGIATFLESNGQIRFGAGDGFPRYWQGPQLEQERWYTLVYHVYLNKDPSQGFVEVWFDGVQQTLLNGSTRMYGETIQTNETYLKAGIFRSSSSTGVSLIEHDDIAVGTSLSIVMAY